MANKFLIIGVVAVVLVAAVAGAALLLSNQGSSDETEKVAKFVATSLSLDNQNVTTGQPLFATIGMKNNGTADGEYDVRMFLDGVQVNHTMISLGAGNSTTVKLSTVCNVAGTSTIKVEDKTANFTCIDRYVAGDIMKWHLTGYDAESAQEIDGYMTTEVVSANSTGFTLKTTYDGIVGMINSTTEHTYDEVWSDGLDNLTFIGMSDVATSLGTKTLSHYTYTYDAGSYHYVYDLYVDEATQVSFKISSTFDTPSGESNLSFDLVESNTNWVSGI